MNALTKRYGPLPGWAWLAGTILLFRILAVRSIPPPIAVQTRTVPTDTPIEVPRGLPRIPPPLANAPMFAEQSDNCGPCK
jgi:hypothetical protein